MGKSLAKFVLGILWGRGGLYDRPLIWPFWPNTIQRISGKAIL